MRFSPPAIAAESPAYAKLSLAADMTLGFRPGRFWRNARMTCINLLLTYTDGCRANCSYCGLARERQATEKTFIHVTWPIRSMDEIIARLNRSSVARRTCISMVTHPRARLDTLAMAERLVAETPQPVSVLLGPTISDRDYLTELHAAGVDKIGIALDAATEELFARHRGKPAQGPHRWDTYWERIAEAVDVFGQGSVGSHFVVGLGEREEDLVRCFQRVRDLGGLNHLFSFLPEPGSALEDQPPPPIDSYRRVQLACYLVDRGLSTLDHFSFDPETGRILGFGVSATVLHDLIDSGEPFRTRGCTGCDGESDCNRPFGNSFPGKTVRNYPFPLERKDIHLVREQLAGKRTQDANHPAVGGKGKRKVIFAVPNFKHYVTDNYSNRGNGGFLSVSVTGKGCRLMCTHCQGKLIEPMTAAETPQDLLDLASRIKSDQGTGLLISGGSRKDGTVPLEHLAEAMRRIKQELGLKLAVHSKFLTRPLAESLAGVGLDAMMVDAPASERIIREVYNLPDRGFDDVRRTMDLMGEFDLPASPHLLLGFGDESNRRERVERVLSILKGRELQSLVVVFLMPLPGTPMERPEPMPLEEVERVFRKVRRMFRDCPVYLGCARPPGSCQVRVEILALKHRFDGIAFPLDETVDTARKRGYEVSFEECCCAVVG